MLWAIISLRLKSASKSKLFICSKERRSINEKACLEF